MSYQDKIKATQMEAFAELFEIITLSQSYYYTSYHTNIFFQSHTYKARPISRNDLSFGEKLRSVRVRISAPLDAPFLNYLASFPPDHVKVKITRVFLDTMNDYIQLFSGYIIGITLENKIAHAECESETRLLRNKIPKILFQAWCNHMLFDAGCGLNENDYGVAIRVDSLETPDRIISSDLGSYENGYFSLGYVKFENDLRFIEDHYIPQEGPPLPIYLKIHFQFKKLKAGDIIIVYPGCDKSYETCRDKFNNLARRLAFDNIPSSNPVMWGVGNTNYA